MKLFTKKQQDSYENAKICKEIFWRINYIVKLDIIVIIQKCRNTAHSICNLKYSVPTNIPIVFHNRSSYDYHFIINKLAEEFKI